VGVRLLQLGAAMAVLGAVFGVSSGSAAAHADLLRAEPAAGSELRQSPTQLTLYFSQGLKPNGSFIQVVDEGGNLVPAQVTFDDGDSKMMRASVPTLAPGVYKVRWQTLSANDDDYHDGAYSLTVLNPDGSRPASAAPARSGDDGSSASIVLIAVSIAVVLIVGGLALYIRGLGRQPR
jgi:methionine-rich copper-binding protein CopC